MYSKKKQTDSWTPNISGIINLSLIFFTYIFRTAMTENCLLFRPCKCFLPLLWREQLICPQVWVRCDCRPPESGDYRLKNKTKKKKRNARTMERLQLTTERWENTVRTVPRFSTIIFPINFKARSFSFCWTASTVHTRMGWW